MLNITPLHTQQQPARPIIKHDRYRIRWYILIAVNCGRPFPVAEPLILSVIRSVPIECTVRKLRQHLNYLAGRKFVELRRLESGPWLVALTRHGANVVDEATRYAIPEDTKQ